MCGCDRSAQAPPLSWRCLTVIQNQSPETAREWPREEWWEFN